MSRSPRAARSPRPRTSRPSSKSSRATSGSSACSSPRPCPGRSRARVAAEPLGGKVRTIDSADRRRRARCSASHPAPPRAWDDGRGGRRARRALQGARGLLFTVDTLDYLHRGGRVGRAAKFAGQLLNVKPILTITDGEVVPLKRACAARRRRSASFRRSSSSRHRHERAQGRDRARRRARPRGAARQDGARRATERRHRDRDDARRGRRDPRGPGTVGFFWFTDDSEGLAGAATAQPTRQTLLSRLLDGHGPSCGRDLSVLRRCRRRSPSASQPWSSAVSFRRHAIRRWSPARERHLRRQVPDRVAVVVRVAEEREVRADRGGLLRSTRDEDLHAAEGSAASASSARSVGRVEGLFAASPATSRPNESR